MYTFLDENFIVAICFVIFLYLSYKPLRRAIISSLDTRIIEIKSKLEETEKLKEDARLLLENIEQEMSGFEMQKSQRKNCLKKELRRWI